MSTTPAQPGPDGSHPVDPPKKGLPGWLIPLIAALVALALLLLLLSQCGNDEDEEDTAAVAPAPTATEPEPTAPQTVEDLETPSPTASAPAAPTTPAATPSATGAPGAPALPQAGPDDVLVTASGVAVLPLVTGATDGSLTGVVGEPVTADGVVVQSVVTDKGFWVGPSADERAFVRFVVEGESEVDITEGQTLDFEGVVVEAPVGFAEEIGLAEDEGLSLLESQGAYIQVEPSALEVVAPA
ncbi:hypothetical protein [uncultured Pseudokineococcus sp.]|uniref:hypothetical protein n=1 Tax=uncultured Pseudokineococcus sp. TaxID=1642928 RepID=UPI00260C50DD|nr:hypothetical protein [uncultured Pseudokineococcus sp.]